MTESTGNCTYIDTSCVTSKNRSRLQKNSKIGGTLSIFALTAWTRTYIGIFMIAYAGFHAR
jgi:hypothetical protein